ncbi:hypothetical protein CL619_02835 [archaeon]|nr:hypothetical protein [archaeon]|tara:strand:- start:178 stop:1305 length:1128 start_codon:yes stop_codon:yes gene_type:complete
MKLTLIFSDTELGAGNRSDDFIEEDLFCNTVRSLFVEAKKQPTDLVFNGDTFDFVKCPTKDGHYHRHFTEKRSLEKVSLIKKAHPKSFKVFKDFLKLRSDNRIIFIYGNHDYDLVFEGVQVAIARAICGRERKLEKQIFFPGFEFRDNLLFVEHGSQLDFYFKVHPKKFVHQGNHFFPEPFLKTPWGYNALYEFYMEYKERYPLVERLLPREYAAAALPKKIRRELVIGSIWYLFKSFFYTQFVEFNDPLRRFPFSTFTSYFSKMVRRDFHLHFLRKARKKLKRSNYQVYSVGHNHTGTMLNFNGKIIINTGAWRDEYLYNPEIDAFLPKMKSYGYVLHDAKKIHAVELREVSGKQEAIFFEDINEKTAMSMRFV